MRRIGISTARDGILSLKFERDETVVPSFREGPVISPAFLAVGAYYILDLVQSDNRQKLALFVTAKD